MGACFHYRSQENARRRRRQGSFGFWRRMSPTSTEIVALPTQLLSLSLSLSLSLFLSLFLSLSLSLSRMQTHTHTHAHTRRDHCCCSFFSRVISHLSCGVLDVHLALSFHCDTHRHSLFFRLEFAAFLCFILEQILFQSKAIFLYFGEGPRKIKVKKHARTHTPKAAKLSTCLPQQAGVRNYSSVELSFL